MAKQSNDGIRGTLNKHPALVGGIVAIVVLLIALLWFRSATSTGEMRYYSIDDGATYFAHVEELPPFKYSGKEAVQAMVYKFKDGKPFVAYLMRFTEAGKKQQRENIAHPTPARLNGMADVPEIQAKKPNGEWITRGAPGYEEAVSVRCPEGDGSPQAVAVPAKK